MPCCGGAGKPELLHEHVLEGAGKLLPLLAVSPNLSHVICGLGKHVIALAGGESLLWETHTPSTISAAAVSGDVAVGGSANGTLYCWSLSDGTERWQVTNEGTVEAICIDGNSVVVCCGAEDTGSVRCLSTDDGTERWVGTHDVGVSAVAFAAGAAVTGGDDSTVKCWGADGEPKWSGSAHKNWVIAVAQCSSTCAVSAGLDHTLVCWGVAEGQAVWEAQGHTEGIVFLVANYAAVISGSKDATVRCWDPQSGAQVWEYEMPDEVSAAGISEDTVAVCSKDGRLCGLALASGSVMWSMQLGSPASALKYLAGDRLACARTGLLAIYQTNFGG